MNLWLRTGAITASLALHAALLIQTGGTNGVTRPVAQTQSVTRLNFSQPTPAPVPESVPEEVAEVEPPKPEPRPRPEPEKKALKKVKPTPEEKPVEMPRPVEQVAAASNEAAQAPQLDEGMIQSKTEAYLATVVAHIERHKWYPKAARRRGIQGHVEVVFMLLPDGSTRAVLVENGPEILLRAARKTMERAAPLPPPPPDIHCPIKCSFRMQFALDGR